MNVRYKRQKGTMDILPNEVHQWQYIEDIARKVFSKYCYSEIRTPLFEDYEVFYRSSGDTSDVVTKEMYDFNDKGNRHIALRPEGTAGIVRAYIENKLFGPEYPKPYKVYYMGPMFRYERPQSGRMREFHQIGVEAFGIDSPLIDAEIISMAKNYLNELGLFNLRYTINTLGDLETRNNYRNALIDYLLPYKNELSFDSQKRLDKNPLRILDSKDDNDKKIISEAPSILDFLTFESKKYFDELKLYLSDLNIEYEIDSTMVRGLDYYTHTIFEIISNDNSFNGKDITIAAGGRYNNLVTEMGGPYTPGIGFGVGVERLLILLKNKHLIPCGKNFLDVYIVEFGDHSKISLSLAQILRNQGFTVDFDFLDRKLKSQIKDANHKEARISLIIGDDEMKSSEVKLKVMSTGEQFVVPLKNIKQNFVNLYKDVLEG